MPRKTRNTLVVSALAAVALVAGLLAAAGVASSSPSLPAVRPDRLLASVVRSLEGPVSISGHVATHVDVGLPQLPDEGPEASTGPATLLSSITGDHTLRVWESPGGVRITEVLPFGERSIVLSPSGAWAWDSGSYRAYRLASLHPKRGTSDREPAGGEANEPAALLDPLALARRALAGAAPSTSVTVGATDRVAGRDAYTLVVTPRSPGTLVGRVEVAVDAQRRLPLGVAVFARGASKPALSATFTSVGFGPVDHALFRFIPPSGARVVTVPELLAGAGPGAMEYGGFPGGLGDVRVFGRDWTTVVAIRIHALPSNLGRSAGVDVRSFLPFSGPLLSVRIASRGDHDWVIYGAVPQAALAAVERELT